MSGTNISQSDVEAKSQITSVEQDGFWLLANEGEFFVAFGKYPAFRRATVEVTAQAFCFMPYYYSAKLLPAPSFDRLRTSPGAGFPAQHAAGDGGFERDLAL